LSRSFSFEQQLNFTLRLFALLTVVELLNLVTGRQLNQLALVPREVDALGGILISPFLHGSLWHYTSNIVPICLFSFLVMQYGTSRFWKTTAFIFLTTGVLVWLLGRDAFHLGASGIVYGYFGFLLYAGFISRRPKLIFISLAVGFFYGGMIFGVLPMQSYISWESHLFGFISGLAAAKLFVDASTTQTMY
jgi:membrane associated rhomboid family serine protease